jgi:hypothetical protein
MSPFNSVAGGKKKDALIKHPRHIAVDSEEWGRETLKEKKKEKKRKAGHDRAARYPGGEGGGGALASVSTRSLEKITLKAGRAGWASLLT